MRIGVIGLALFFVAVVAIGMYVKRRADTARRAVEARWRDQALANNAAHFARRQSRAEETMPGEDSRESS